MIGFDANGSPIKLTERCSRCGAIDAEEAFSETTGIEWSWCEACHQKMLAEDRKKETATFKSIFQTFGMVESV